ncbi:MAG: DUF488 family protein [Prevotella sp.]|nr:DUF488 family protein [Prevotella sp.]MCM1074705.1 DUF488 family protein [Ruminococcus sp.]
MSQTINIKRAYDLESASDGYRVYIDKLWPRGLSHQTFHYDLWKKNIAPSTPLREWFHTDPALNWPQFQTRYREELEGNPAFAEFKEQLKDKPVITLLYSSHDHVRNNAVIVAALLRE